MESRHHLAPPMHTSSSPNPTQQNQAPAANQGEIDELVKKADGFVSGGKINEALQLYTKALSLNPENVEEILCKRSQTFLHAELYEEAINDARSVLTLNSDGIELLIALLCLGRAFCELKQFERGREALRQAVKLCANEEQVQQVQQELKRIDQAETAHAAASSRRNSSTVNNQSSGSNPILIADDGEGTDEEDEDEFISEASDSDDEAAAQNRTSNNTTTTSSEPSSRLQQPSSSPKKRTSSFTSTSAIPTPQVSSSSSSSTTCNHPRVKLNLTPGEDVSELECPLCYRVFYNPITLPCGHTFDRSCLARVFDYTDKCPLCREVIHILPELYPVTVTLNNLVQKYLKKEYEEREAEEKQQTALDANNIPIFVLDYVLFPNCTLPLHIYEPRYRLMIRRCMAGSRCFGLVSSGENGEIAKFGTIAKIKSIQLLPDGRSLIETVGSRRFKMLSKWEQDGYTCGRVEWLNEDDENPASTTTATSRNSTNTSSEPNPEEERKALLELCTRGHNVVTTAFKEFGPQVQEAIEQKIGKIPPASKPLEFSFWLSSILPMSTAMKVDLLKTTSTKVRLERVISMASEIIHHYKSISGGCTIS